MNRPEFNMFLAGGMILCCLMALISLARIKSKGGSAYFQASSYIAMAAALYLLKNDADVNLIAGAFVVVVGLLVGDFVYRAAKQSRGNKP
jgi:hypothetical protein